MHRNKINQQSTAVTSAALAAIVLTKLVAGFGGLKLA
jgi:hypothetical protein